MNKLRIILSTINFIALAVLIYFALTNFYTWEDETAWLNKTFSIYTIRSDVKILTVFCIILPVIIFLIKRKYYYIIQAILISIIAKNHNEDFFQKTIFINQPTSIQKSNNEIKKLIESSEVKLISIIQKINSQNLDSINALELNQYTKGESFNISSVRLKNKKVESLWIAPKKKTQKYHTFGIEYFPNNYNLKNYFPEIYEFGTEISVLRSRNYFYKTKWIISISGVAEG